MAVNWLWHSVARIKLLLLIQIREPMLRLFFLKEAILHLMSTMAVPAGCIQVAVLTHLALNIFILSIRRLTRMSASPALSFGQDPLLPYPQTTTISSQ